jgi:hypothetical protein
MKKVIVLLGLIIVLLFLVNGCQEKKIEFKFNSSVCGANIGEQNQSQFGKENVEWFSDTLLKVSFLVQTNCADTIKNGDYSISEDKIALYYGIERCTTCTTCLCPRELTYTFYNIPKKDYQFEIKEI